MGYYYSWQHRLCSWQSTICRLTRRLRFTSYYAVPPAYKLTCVSRCYQVWAYKLDITLFLEITFTVQQTKLIFF